MLSQISPVPHVWLKSFAGFCFKYLRIRIEKKIIVLSIKEKKINFITILENLFV